MKNPATRFLGGISERTGFNSKAFNLSIYSETLSPSHPPIADADQKNDLLLSPLPVTPAGKYISRRFRVRPDIADLVASFAGLGPNQRAA